MSEEMTGKEKSRLKKRNELVQIGLTTVRDQAGLANPRIHTNALRSSLFGNTSTCLICNSAACTNVWIIRY